MKLDLHIIERVLPYRGERPFGVACGCGFALIDSCRTYIEAARIAFEHDRAHRADGGRRIA